MPNDPFYRGEMWRRLRGEVIRKTGGTCQGCGCAVRGRNAHVDHIVSRRERPDLAYDIENLQLLCLICHNRKGTRHDGVLGRRPKGPYVGDCDTEGNPINVGHPWNSNER